MKNIKNLFILFVISALLLSITACNQRNDGVFPGNPQAVGSSEMNSIPPHLRNSFLATAATYLIKNPGFQSGIRANVVSDPRGTNLLLQSRVLFLGGNSVVESVPPAEFLGNCDNYYADLMIYLPEVKEINRVFAITNLETQQIDVWGYKFFDDGSYEYQGVFAHGIYGSVIDIQRQTPMFANYLVIEIYPPIRPPFLLGIRELGLYGPQSPLKITSPKTGAQFMAGENIQFTSSASVGLINYQWTWDGVVLGTSPGSPDTTASYLPIGTHTIRVRAQKISDFSEVSDSITIGIQDIAKIKIKNLDAQSGEDPFASSVPVSYRAAKTRFQAIGFQSDDFEIGPVDVDWKLDGGNVVATEQLRLGMLAGLGSLGAGVNKIGAFERANTFITWDHVASSTNATFISFLSGNITLKATKGNASASVSIRIKQPTLTVKVFPVGDTTFATEFDSVTRQVWEKENVIKILPLTEGQPKISSATYPDFPLTPPLQGAESELQDLGIDPSLGKPLVYDCLLGATNGLFNIPRQGGLLLARREADVVNVFLVAKARSYYVSDRFTVPPTKRVIPVEMYPISSRDQWVPMDFSCSIIKEGTPFPAGIGSALGLQQYPDWSGNLMNLTSTGGSILTPLQFIAVLNYNNDNPQNSTMIKEE